MFVNEACLPTWEPIEDFNIEIFKCKTLVSVEENGQSKVFGIGGNWPKMEDGLNHNQGWGIAIIAKKQGRLSKINLLTRLLGIMH
jgi:hypothetical protein